MFFFSNLPDNKLLFNNSEDTFVVFKIETTDTGNDLIEVDDFVNLITRNHQLFLSLEAIVENTYTERMFDLKRNRIRIPFRRSPNIKLNRVSKQSPTTLELAVSGFQLGFDIAELLNELLKRGANSNEFKSLLIRYNIPVELVESLSYELDRMIGKLRPINQFITIFYGIKIN
jgi:hypothetical protein